MSGGNWRDEMITTEHFSGPPKTTFRHKTYLDLETREDNRVN